MFQRDDFFDAEFITLKSRRPGFHYLNQQINETKNSRKNPS